MMQPLLAVGQEILDTLARSDIFALRALLARRRSLLEGLDLSRATPEEQLRLREQDALLLLRGEEAREVCQGDLLRNMRQPTTTARPTQPRLLDVRQ